MRVIFGAVDRGGDTSPRPGQLGAAGRDERRPVWPAGWDCRRHHRAKARDHPALKRDLRITRSTRPAPASRDELSSAEIQQTYIRAARNGSRA